MRSIKAWVIVTPRGRVVIESIMPTRSECIQNYVLELSCFFGSEPIEVWESTFERKGYTCEKVTIRVR